MEQQPPAVPHFAGPQETDDPKDVPAPDAPVTRAKKRRRWVIWLVLLSLFALAFVLILRHKPTGGQGAQARHRSGGTVTLNAAKAHSGDMSIKLLAIGTVTPTYTASITAQVTGKILAVHYREGQTVRKGELLIDIDPGPYQAALDTAQGILLRDQGVLSQARMDLGRYQAAWARNVIARQQLDDQAKLVDQDEGLVRADQGTVEADQVNLAYCHITSPIPGRVGLRLVDPGNIVQANSTTALVVVTQMQPITVVFTIPEDSLPEVRAAMRRRMLKVTAFDRAQQHVLANGRLETTDNQIDTTTGTLKLRAVFENAKLSLFPNQFVNTELLVNVLHDQTLIPASAIQRNGTQAFVYLLKNNTATITNIKTVATDQVNAAVTGIAADDQVANSSFEKLQDKSKVRIVQQRIGASEDSESTAP
jgi:multidrug efflux system membrane fusion protein